jgi:Fe-S oxidoreductase
MDRNMNDALCCGGGGGNFFTDMIGVGVDSPARIRVREALETGAEVLVVACPSCAKMFEDAVKAESLDDKLRVMDLSEIIQARLSSE